jgi:hypothetical protein
MKRHLFVFIAFAALAFPLSAADAPGAKDHPMLKRIEGSEIIWFKASKFDELNLTVAKVVAVGVGMAAPVAPNTDESGRAKNRRVEIVKM